MTLAYRALLVSISLMCGAAYSQTSSDVTAEGLAALSEEMEELEARRDRLGADGTVTEERLATLIQEIDAIATALESGTAPSELSERFKNAREDVASIRTDVEQDERNAGQAAQLVEILRNRDQAGTDMLRHFGVGLVLASDIRGPDRVEGASIIDGKVVVEADRNVRAGVILEYHRWMFCERLDFDDPDYARSSPNDPFENGSYRAVPRIQGAGRNHAPTEEELQKAEGKRYLKQVPPCNVARRASGLFVGVQPGSNELVDAIGFGWMWRLPDKFGIFGDRALNIGFGIMSDPNVPVLGAGFVENENAPLDSSNNPLAIRLRETDKSAYFITASLELGGN